MKVVQLNAENFKRLRAVDITPEGNVVTIGGKNGSGKSSVLDAIYVALVGRSAAPPRPVREGEEVCHIKLDLGEIKVTRRFTQKADGIFTDGLKVENAEGMVYKSPQAVLDALLGEIGFDPFEFVKMEPKRQAETLLHMVPLSVDLDELAEADREDFNDRTLVNRELASLRAQVDSIPEEQVPENAPDRNALTDQLGNAANHNAEVQRLHSNLEVRRQDLAELEQRVDEAEKQLADMKSGLAGLREALEKAEETPIPALIDTDEIREKLRNADEDLARIERQRRRAELVARATELSGRSEALTERMKEREAARRQALQKAKMPIEGLGFAVDERGKPVVMFGGVPFEQASSAEQLRASTAIAMAANPTLRVLRVKDGALLDDDSLRMLSEMAEAEDFQLWVEVVGNREGVGIIMENGEAGAAQ